MIGSTVKIVHEVERDRAGNALRTTLSKRAAYSTISHVYKGTGQVKLKTGDVFRVQRHNNQIDAEYITIG